MPPYFGPLSADEPTLKGLSKYEALNLIRRKIKHAIKQRAPPRPDRQLTHNPLHKETGPWLCLGTGPLDQKDAGRWYQICTTCDPAIVQFLTTRLDEQYTQSSLLMNLFNTYHEVRFYFDDEQDGAASFITEAEETKTEETEAEETEAEETEAEETEADETEADETETEADDGT